MMVGERWGCECEGEGDRNGCWPGLIRSQLKRIFFSRQRKSFTKKVWPRMGRQLFSVVIEWY